MRDVSDQSEQSEPLLSRRLYDTYREASTENIDTALSTTEELLRRRFVPEAQETEQQAAQAIENIREGVEAAAEGVLGDEAESLRLAQQQLDELIRQLNEEAARAGRAQAGDPNAAGPGDPNQMFAQGMPPRPGQEPQDGQPGSEQQQQANGQSGQGQQQQANAQGGQQPPDGQDPQQQQANAQGGQRQGGQPQEGQQQARGQGGQQPGQGRDGQPPEGQEGQRQVAQGGQQRQMGGAGGSESRGPSTGIGSDDFIDLDQWTDERPEGDDLIAPLTGEDFLQWSDRLRDVEEMLPEEELRNDAAVVRDRAREFRTEFTRHGTEPQWDLVQEQITAPLSELRQRVGERLAQLESDDALVPIDRDPVPGRYAEAVRRYFENLGDESR